MAYIKVIKGSIAPAIPDGKTVTPTDDIATWLACGARSEAYTTLSQILADSTCLTALINDNNAVDYLVRSTTWASDICTDSGAMGYIGLNNYCADTLLADATWCNAICNSTYFESVLNVKVPRMTSNTTPSGVASSSSGATPAYYAFDQNSSTRFLPSEWASTSDYFLKYDFGKEISLSKIFAKVSTNANMQYNVSIYGSKNDSDYSPLYNFTASTPGDSPVDFTHCVQNSEYRYFKLRISGQTYAHVGGQYGFGVYTLQFYGREDI